jgi:hypothetical protein
LALAGISLACESATTGLDAGLVNGVELEIGSRVVARDEGRITALFMKNRRLFWAVIEPPQTLKLRAADLGGTPFDLAQVEGQQAGSITEHEGRLYWSTTLCSRTIECRAPMQGCCEGTIWTLSSTLTSSATPMAILRDPEFGIGAVWVDASSIFWTTESEVRGRSRASAGERVVISADGEVLRTRVAF